VNDLRTDLVNAVPATSDDPAFWQHMATFTVGLGLTGSLDPNTDLPALTDGSKSWPKASNHQIDDMWHAAVNGHGQFFSAKNVNEFSTALADSLVEIKSRQATASKAGLSSSKLQIDTDIYQGKMNTGDWSGEFISFAISDGVDGGTACPGTGTVKGLPCPTANWNAATQLTNSLNGSSTHYDTGRKIVTYKPSTHTGVTFRWTNLDTSQQTVLKTNPDDGSTESTAIAMRRLNYLRGKADGTFRLRSNYLGDIAYSSPVHVGIPKASYKDDWNGASTEPEDATGKEYSTFKSNNSSRARRVYVGANDGMLHAFDTATGDEVFAYIPSAVYGTVDVANKKYGRLNQLTSPSYVSSHLYFVDGAMSSEDVFYNNNWHTALAGTLRGGGRGVYALDITSDTPATESAAAAKVIWEFTEADDADLGLTFGEPYIARMQNGKWAVVVGNGYNNSTADGAKSSSGHAVLFVLFFDADLTDGQWDLGTDYIKIDTKVGSTATPNGLASPSVTDVDLDFIGDYVYAGDLQGNMWKFDLTDSDPTKWDVALGSTATPAPLFTAKDSGGTAQSITSAPEIGLHPISGYFVYFGTGKMIEQSDNLTTGQQTQTFYGVWDKNGTSGGHASFSRSHMLEQKIVYEDSTLYEKLNGTKDTVDFRVVSQNDISWHDTSGTPSSPVSSYLGWYMDLVNTQGGNTNNKGEKQTTNALLAGGRLFYTTVIPSNDPCDAGGDGWMMVVDPITGGRLKTDVFDVTLDVDLDGDGKTETVAVSGRGFESAPSGPSLVRGKDKDYVYVGSKEDDTIDDNRLDIEATTVEHVPGSTGRRSWQQLM